MTDRDAAVVEAGSTPFAALVRAGLACFWRETMGEDGGLADWLAPAPSPDTEPHAAWHEALGPWSASWPPPVEAFGDWSRLGRLAVELDAGPAETFLIALLGLAESDYRVTLALAELLGRDRQVVGGEAVRAELHLVGAILESLFDTAAPDVLALAGSPAVRSGVLVLQGDGPLPLRGIGVDPALWAVLCGRTQPWPGCRLIAPADDTALPAAAREAVPVLAGLLARGEVHGLVVRGHGGSGRGDFAAALAHGLGLAALELPSPEILTNGGFMLGCRLAGWLPVVRAELGAGETMALPAGDRTPHGGPPLLVLAGRHGAFGGRPLLEFELGLPDENERRALWTVHLGAGPGTDALAASALLSAATIKRLALDARLRAGQAGEAVNAGHVADARAELGADALRLAAQPVRRRVGADAVVFPPMVARHLDELIARARRRESIWQALGPTLQASRSSGVRALFAGDSGTGKTLAASHVATRLDAPLYRVDLSAIMNKYIGETEKNLATLLDRAAAADAILLFDEADSLFGRRTEARQSGERYANMLTNYLLSAIELHPGVVLLTSNARDRIDNAFSRRLDAIIDFPLPGPPERLRLWHSHLGARAPEAAVCALLAQCCEFSGGQIRNAVLGAVAQAEAPPAGVLPVRVLVESIRREYQKLGRALPARLEPLTR